MNQPRRSNWLTIGLGIGSTLLLGMNGCRDKDAGLVLAAAGSAGSDANGGSDPTAGTSGTTSAEAGADPVGGQGGEADETAGTSGSASGGKGGSNSHSNAGSEDAGDAGSESEDNGGDGGTSGTGGSGTGGTDAGTGGTGGTDAGGTGGTSGDGGTGGDAPIEATCIFTSAPAPSSGGSGGTGGAGGMSGAGGAGGAPVAGGVKVATNAFLGPYLTDSAGMTLYIYGADMPGDCNNPPVSNCSADCAVAWPIFDAKERTLDAALDPAVFGTIERGDGTFQTTYYGWPLYYYKSDTTPNTINGQGKGKTWFTAEVALPNLMIMRGPVAGGGIKYLSDDRGYTLYALSGDTVGSDTSEPTSACTDGCLDSFKPYSPGQVYPVTPLEPHDITLFFRADGSPQVAYKGAPLYFSKIDVRSGETNGLSLFGGALVLP